MKTDNCIDYLEFPSRDLSATKTFFSRLVSWEFQDYGPDYIAFDDGKVKGGFYRSATVSSALQGSPLVVFYHSNLEEIKNRVVDLKGTISKDIFSFPGGRRFQFTEPGGTEFAFWCE